MKKVVLGILVVLMTFVLTACYEGEITSLMEIKSEDGAGTKTVTCTVYKKGAVNRKKQIVDENEKDSSKTNMGVMKDDPEGIYEWLVENAPEGVDVSWEDKDDRVLFHLSWSFNSFDDYNAVNKRLAGSNWDQDRHTAYFTTADVAEGTLVEMKEEIDTTYATIWWALEGIHGSGKLDSSQYDNNPKKMAVPWSWTVKIGGRVVEAAWLDGDIGVRYDTYINATGVLSDEPVDEHPGEVPALIESIGNLREVSIITGPDSINNTQEKWDVGGTDLGILFGDETIYMAFGDTFSSIVDGNFGPNWRSNVLAVIKDSDPAEGLLFEKMITGQGNPNSAIQFIPGPKNGNETGPFGGFQVTTIPTGGFEHNGALYVTYMSISNWGEIGGTWKCNYGGIAKSTDKGQTWSKLENLRWDGNGNFVQMAPAKSGDYMYFWCIPAGRYSGVSLMRVSLDNIENYNEYEYYQYTDSNGNPVYKKGETAIKTARQIVPPVVGEHSVVYNEYADAWIMMYLNEKAAAIQLRYAERPEGPWSEPFNVTDSDDYFGIYGAFMHPKLVSEGGKKICFAMSKWLPVYNVSWMEVELFKADETPDETEPDETEPEETLPDETEPDETIPDETLPDETKPDETIPDETVPDETQPDETVPDDQTPVPTETDPDEDPKTPSDEDPKTPSDKDGDQVPKTADYFNIYLVLLVLITAAAVGLVFANVKTTEEIE